jgi:hypothetical protein
MLSSKPMAIAGRGWNYALVVDAGGVRDEPRTRTFKFESVAVAAMRELESKWLPYAEIRDATGRLVARGRDL